MENVLITLKRLLNSINDKELKGMELWIDAADTISAIVLDKNSVSLITNTDKLQINGKDW